MTAHTISCVTSSEQGLFSNTYLVEAPFGVVVVDPPMLLSDARAVARRLEQTGRPLAGIIYTHPHPDHVNGGTVVRGSTEVPVFATPETDRVSRAIDADKRAFWTQQFPDDYPPVTTFATDLVPGGRTVDVGGATFEVVDIGAGECAAASLWVTGSDAFVGDLAYAGAHPWLFEGRSAAWLAQLDAATPVLAGRTLHLGHGGSGGLELLTDQTAYLTAYRDAVRELAGGRPALDQAATARLVERMVAFWPHAALVDLVAMSADAVAAELAAESA